MLSSAKQKRFGRCLLLVLAALVAVSLVGGRPVVAGASKNGGKLQKRLSQHPEADADGDGVLTAEEAEAFREKSEAEQQRRLGRGGGPKLRMPDFQNVSYGPNERHVLDFWKAESDSPTPVVLWFHGGGFETGGKETVRNRTLIPKLLDRRVSFASANYRLRNTTPIQDILRDGARAVQFLRYKSDDWNIDEQRIAAWGGSAGAGMAVWIGVHDDLADPARSDPVLRESSRVAAIVGFGAQCSYDMAVWARLVYPPEDNSPKRTMIHRFYGFAKPEQIDTPEGRKIRADVDAYGLLTKDDPPMLLFSAAKDVPPGNPEYSGNHHPRHAVALKKKADTLGVECETWFLHDEPRLPENATTDDVVLPFLMKHLSSDKAFR